MRLAQRGAAVVISSRDAAACAETAEFINATGMKATAIPAHIGYREQLETLASETLARFGGIDILVCNAAVNPYYGPLSEITDDAWDRIMSSNVRSTLWLCNLAVPSMRERGGGSIVMLSSIAGLSGTAVIGAYAVSKAALSQLARNLAVEHGPHGIRVNAIAPGIVTTDFARALWENPKIADAAIQRSALRRLAKPDDVAGVAVFLAARASSYVTGQTIVVDGGVTIDAGM